MDNDSTDFIGLVVHKDSIAVACTVVAEAGDFARVSHPRRFMAWLGLVPAEHSSGGTRRQGGITKTGNC